MPKIKVKRQTKYYILRRFSQGHTNPSNYFSEIFNQDTKRLNVKSTKELDPTDDPTDGNASIDSNNFSHINTRTGTPTVSSKTKLEVPTDLQGHKSIERSRMPLRHSYIEKLHAFDNTRGHSSNHHRQVGENAHTNYRGRGLTERQNEQSSRGGKSREGHKWNVNHNGVIINNNKGKGIPGSIFNKKRSQRMRKPLSLISFNQVRNNNNINNNNNAAGSVNYNPIDNGLDSSDIRSAHHNCWFVVCLGLYVNDAVLSKNKQSKKKIDVRDKF